MPEFSSYNHMKEQFPILAKRLHTLHCESSKPMGVSYRVSYEGDQYNGAGIVKCTLQYGYKSFPIRVRNGVIYAFGRQQSMYRKTTMMLSNGTRTTYDDGDCLLPNKK